MLRLPDGMRDRIKVAAERNGRSMNAEIVAVLDEKFPPLISADRLTALIEASAGLLDAVENVVPSDKNSSKNVAILRSHLEKVQREAESNIDAAERRQLFDDTEIIFNRIANRISGLVDEPEK
ncbi:hypothetical protein A3720_21005 [Sulfitobacter sp. HI0021]|nr:hypothetical protein A3720_21005 [Sulfitobacter sp. HI0021]